MLFRKAKVDFIYIAILSGKEYQLKIPYGLAGWGYKIFLKKAYRVKRGRNY